MTTPPSGSGGTWTRAICPPTSIPACLRVQCRIHGVLSIASTWAEPGSGLTRALEARVIDLAKECSLEAVRRLSGLSWDRCWGVLGRAVDRGQRRKVWKVPVHLGVDEKAFAKRHRYMTLVCDLQTRSVEHVAEGRGRESLEEYSSPSTKTSWSESRPSAWTCTTPTSRPCEPGCPTPRTRSCSTSSTSCD